jgi:hypothetical protein
MNFSVRVSVPSYRHGAELHGHAAGALAPAEHHGFGFRGGRIGFHWDEPPPPALPRQRPNGCGLPARAWQARRTGPGPNRASWPRSSRFGRGSLSEACAWPRGFGPTPGAVLCAAGLAGVRGAPRRLRGGRRLAAPRARQGPRAARVDGVRDDGGRLGVQDCFSNRPTSMPRNILECRVSKMVNSDTRPRAHERWPRSSPSWRAR